MLTGPEAPAAPVFSPVEKEDDGDDDAFSVEVFSTTAIVNRRKTVCPLSAMPSYSPACENLCTTVHIIESDPLSMFTWLKRWRLMFSFMPLVPHISFYNQFVATGINPDAQELYWNLYGNQGSDGIGRRRDRVCRKNLHRVLKLKER